MPKNFVGIQRQNRVPGGLRHFSNTLAKKSALCRNFGGGGGGYDPLAAAFIAEFNNVSAAEMALEQQSVCNTIALMLKGEGTTNGSDLTAIIDDLNFYCPADNSTSDFSGASLNFMNPSRFKRSFFGFLPGDLTVNGITGGAGKYIRTGYVPSVEQTLGDCSYFWHTLTGGSGAPMGSISSDANAYTSAVFSFYGNNSNYAAGGNDTNTAGLYCVSKTGSTVKKYANGAPAQNSFVATSGALSTVDFADMARYRLGAFQLNYTGEVMLHGRGKAFTDQEFDDFAEICNYIQSNIISGGRA